GAVFALEPEDEERPAGAAEDSNDIYILPSGGSTLASPPESPTTATASWQAEGFPVSLSSSQSWRTESPPVSLGPESWQQVTVDPEEVKSLDSNGAGEKSENNSSNSDIVHVEKEEIPEGAEAAAVAAPALLAAGEPGPEGSAGQPASPTTSLFVELAEEEAGAAASGAAELEQEGVLPLEPPVEPPAAPPGGGQAARGWGGLGAGPSPGGPEEAGPPPEGKSLLLLGGAAAAVAILAVAVGVALALRRNPAAQVLCWVSAASQVLPCPPRPRVPRGPVQRARPMLPAVPLVKMLPLVFKRTRRKRPGAPVRDRGASLSPSRKLEGGLAGLSRLLAALLSVGTLEPTGTRQPAVSLLLGIAVRDLD
ncbi:hypothetical protein EI555_021327, partial [Monodon monoceros]